MVFEYVFWLLSLNLLANALCFTVLLAIYKNKTEPVQKQDAQSFWDEKGVIMVHDPDEEQRQEQFARADKEHVDLPMDLKDDYDR